MPSALPVPSRAALRTLRRIALGTSCTIAATAAVFTEDRRRRIHIARKACDNAKKIKASRQYCTGGSERIAALEQKVLAYQGRDILQNVDGETPKPPTRPKVPSKPEKPGSLPKSPSNNATKSTRDRPRAAQLGRKTVVPEPGPQQKLTGALRSILQDESLSATERAFGEFTNHFRPAMAQGLNLDNDFMDNCLRLYQLCRKYEKYVYCQRILSLLTTDGHRPIDRNTFFKFEPEFIIDEELQRIAKYRPHQDKIRKRLAWAVSLYTTPFTEKQTVMPDSMRRVGLELCKVASEALPLKMTAAVHQRMRHHGLDKTLDGLRYLIKAANSSDKHQLALSFFQKFYRDGQPSQLNFYDTVSIVMDSASKIGDQDRELDILAEVSEMARERQLKTSTTWLLRVLGSHWENTRDISTTKSLLKRLESYNDNTSHPQALYTAMLQFSVEAGDSESAVHYSKMAGPLDVKGHLALSRAQKGDWEGAAQYLNEIKLANDPRCIPFTPILKLYIESHSTAETEAFVRKFIEEFGVHPDQNMLNLLVGMYARAGELHLILHWIRYFRQHRVELNAVSLNTILSNCQKAWSVPFPGLMSIALQVQQLDRSMINMATIDILRRAAIVHSARNPRSLQAMLDRIEKLIPIRLRRDGPSSSLQVLNAMEEAMIRDDPKKALNIYNAAVSENILLNPEVSFLAVRLMVQHSGGEGLESAMQILQELQQKGADIEPGLTPLVIQQVEKASAHHDDIEELLRHITGQLRKRDIELSIRVVTHAMSCLVNSRRHKLALDLSSALMNLMGERSLQEQMDIGFLHVLFRASVNSKMYVKVEMIFDIMEKYQLQADTKFKHLVKAIRRQVRRELEQYPHSAHLKYHLDVLERGMAIITALRKGKSLNSRAAEESALKVLQIALAEESNSDSVPIHDRPSSSKFHKHRTYARNQRRKRWLKSAIERRRIEKKAVRGNDHGDQAADAVFVEGSYRRNVHRQERTPVAAVAG